MGVDQRRCSFKIGFKEAARRIGEFGGGTLKFLTCRREVRMSLFLVDVVEEARGVPTIKGMHQPSKFLVHPHMYS